MTISRVSARTDDRKLRTVVFPSLKVMLLWLGAGQNGCPTGLDLRTRGSALTHMGTSTPSESLIPVSAVGNGATCCPARGRSVLTFTSDINSRDTQQPRAAPVHEAGRGQTE
ncbi:hypothetical protein GCM10010293_22570 [Streptomyces griseoflavus]|nr:hypothetical protein GCM10010293_22570 [Streptomyces griseoflavus]